MKKCLIIFFAMLCNVAFSQQYCIPGRFDTTNVFTEMELDSVIVQYGQNLNWVSVPSSLSLTMYYPNMTIDTMHKRPFVLLVHGGSFRNGSRYDLVSEVQYFAKKGYVSATIDYRLGWAGSNPANCSGDNNLHINAVYRAVQDAKAALRFISANASIYHIDSTNIFIGGTSSGAFTSLGVGFISQDEFNIVKPGISTLLGPLDSASNIYTDTYVLKGILSYKGAIWDSIVIDDTDALPTIFLHGTADPYYPYLTGNAYTCSSYFMMQGSGLLAERLDHLEMCYELNYKVNGDHGDIYPATYTLGRRALFMKRILCGECDQIIVEDQVMIVDTLIVAMQEYQQENALPDFVAYPNPISDYVILRAEVDGNFRYEIYSAAMQVIREDSFCHQTRIDCVDLPEGLYVLVVYDEKQRVVDRIKVVKMQ